MFYSVYSVFIVLFCVPLVCKCVLYYCHWVSTQLQLTNIISYHFTKLNSNFIKAATDVNACLWIRWRMALNFCRRPDGMDAFLKQNYFVTWTLRKTAIRFFETSGITLPQTEGHIPEQRNPQLHLRETRISCKVKCVYLRVINSLHGNESMTPKIYRPSQPGIAFYASYLEILIQFPHDTSGRSRKFTTLFP
jgi:hypothetical protein